MAKVYKIATIAGDGIGLEVLPEGVKVVKAAAQKYGIRWCFKKYAEKKQVEF